MRRDIIALYGQWLLRSRLASTGRQTAVQSLPAGLAELGEDLEIPAGTVEDAARRKQYLIDVTSEACSTCRQLRVDRCIPAGIQARELELLCAALLLGDDHQLSVSPVAAEQPIEELALLCQAQQPMALVLWLNTPLDTMLLRQLRALALTIDCPLGLAGPGSELVTDQLSSAVRPLPFSGQRPARRGSHCGSCCPAAWTPESGQLQPAGFPVQPSQLLLELLDIASDTFELAALARGEQHGELLFNPVTHCEQTGVLLPRP